MIKINLLPRTINEKAVVRNTAIMFGGLIVLVALVGVLYTQLFLIPQVRAEEDLATQTEALEQEVLGIEKEVAEWRTNKIPPVQKKLTFINDVIAYNQKYPQLYEEIAKWTYEKISYVALASNGTEVNMVARAKNLEDLGRFLLNMYRAQDLFTEVAISGVPGYPMGSADGGGGFVQQSEPTSGGGGPEANLAGIGAITAGVQAAPATGYIGFTVKCKLKTPIVAPTFAGQPGDGQGDQGMPGAPPPNPDPGMSVPNPP
ncbi:MAG: PilN domain-containing protein [Armatimonadota bacterium]|jgi:hypothetical protein